MKKGDKVRIKEDSEYYDMYDVHNPYDKIGTVKLVVFGIDMLPIVVDWGIFTNSYDQKDLLIVKPS
jgi:hypothetical protein